MSELELKNIDKNFGKVSVIKDVNLQIKKGEFVVFVGPSGCGKSTLLRLIAGLEDISCGELFIDDQKVNDIPPSMRGIAMVFQSYALYPHLSVYDNMAFSLQVAKVKRAEIKKMVEEAAQKLQLTPYLSRLPKELSGGQRQRVAIGRTIVRNPKIFLFDEPLSNLDAALRVATRIEIANLKESMPDSTMIYVTHDQVEAMTLAERIVVLNQGRVEQAGPPLELYEKPANLFVAQFIGSPAMNIVKTQLVGEKLLVAGGCECSQLNRYNSEPAFLGVRPEHLELAEKDREPLFKGEITFIEKLGEVTLVYLKNKEYDEPIIAKLQGNKDFSKGVTIELAPRRTKHIHLFDSDGQNAVV